MNIDLKEILKGAIGTTLWEAVRFLIGILLTLVLALFTSELMTGIFASLSELKIYLSIILVLLGIIIFLKLYKRISRYHPNFKRLDYDFRLIKKELTYEYEDINHMVYKKCVVLKALKKDLYFYRDKYSWTGRGAMVIKSGIKEQKIKETEKRGVWQFYEIQFPKTLKKNEEIETEVIWILTDTERQAVPFTSSDIEEPLELLKINIKLPPSLLVEKVTCEETAGIAIKKPYLSEIRNLNRNGEYSWEIKNPKLFHHYEIRWDFPI
jgi:hypothetical protein